MLKNIILTTKAWKSHVFNNKKRGKITKNFTNINGDIIPIEVKSGNNTTSNSLNYYIKRFNPKYSIRISTKNFGFSNNIKSIPLYAAHLLSE